MFSRSIRFRLTLWYALPLAVILTASGIFWHVIVARELLHDIDHRLLFVTRSVQFFQQETKDGYCQQIDRFLQWRQGDEVAQVFDSGGTLLCAVGPAELARGTAGLPAPAAADEPEFRFERSPGQAPVRTLTVPVFENSQLVRVVRVADGTAEREEALGDLRTAYYVFGPLTLVFLSLAGWYLAGHALAPMRRMASAARQITAENLHLRLPIETKDDEVAVLAENCNAMLARLEKSFRRVKQFSGDASHELRTPLAILRGETEVTLRWARDAEEYRRTLESNLEEINRMGRIIEDLLTLAKSDAGELPLEITDLSLSDLLQELYMQGNTLGESKRISVDLHLEVAEEIRMRGDELRLRQVLLNLIANGIKYTGPDGRVDITLQVAGNEAIVRIADTGIGIPAEHLPHIFDRFYRIDKARNRADGGTGLGLAISKGIVEAHGGRIDVESTPGRGSTFSVHLPLQGPPPKEARAAENGFR